MEFNNKRKKILFIQNKILPYRIPLYEYLQKNYGDITVCHISNPVLPESGIIKEVILKSTTVKGFYFLRGLSALSKEFDIIVGMFDLRWPSIWTLPRLLKSNQKMFFWGIGVSTEKGFDVDRRMDFFRFKISRLAKGIIFYSDYPVKKYLQHGFKKDKLFVANNTVYSEKKIDLNTRKFEKFLFLGSLTKRKNIYLLINAFEKVIHNVGSKIYLEIAGDGPERISLENYVKSKGLGHVIKFTGAVFATSQKTGLFQNAICTISPGQAGLSVLESFSYGVPFVTDSQAITGGERFNIIENETGFFIDEKKDLVYLMNYLANNESLMRLMAKNCLEYYWDKRQMSNMAQGFINAFDSDLI